MVRETMEVTKEWYDKINKGYLSGEERLELFGESLCCGYGIYGYSAREKDGKYYCDYMRGNTCD